jgi:hypothetical protein
MDMGDENSLGLGDRTAGLGHAGPQRRIRLIGVPPGIDEVGASVGLKEVDEDIAQRVVGKRYWNAPKSGAHPLHRR